MSAHGKGALMKPVHFSLRAATLEDEPFLLALRTRTMTRYLRKAGQAIDEAAHLARIRFHLEDARINQRDGVDVGLLKAYRSDGQWVISQIQILPQYQHQGIGASAIRSVLALAARDNMPVSLQVLKVNPAQHLYAKLGFYIVSETTSAYHMRADT